MADTKRRCQVLDSEGKRCGHSAVASVRYHGDAEIYGCREPSVSWVLVYVCRKHLSGLPTVYKVPEQKR